MTNDERNPNDEGQAEWPVAAKHEVAHRCPGSLRVSCAFLIANGKRIEGKLPCSIEEFLKAQGLLPRSVVVEHNGEAVAPSEFSQRQLRAGDRLEKIGRASCRE